MDSVGEGEGGMIWENYIETCIISYMKRIASPGLMHDTGCLWLVHWDELEGWDGEGVGEGHYYYTSKLHVYALIYCIGIFLSGLLHSV